MEGEKISKDDNFILLGNFPMKREFECNDLGLLLVHVVHVPANALKRNVPEAQGNFFMAKLCREERIDLQEGAVVKCNFTMVNFNTTKFLQYVCMVCTRQLPQTAPIGRHICLRCLCTVQTGKRKKTGCTSHLMRTRLSRWKFDLRYLLKYVIKLWNICLLRASTWCLQRTLIFFSNLLMAVYREARKFRLCDEM